jgi:hypothetical protein
MTPQEKAWELNQKYMEMQHYLENDAWNNAKECALIAVNEILADRMPFEHSSVEYWKEVKKEIENL